MENQANSMNFPQISNASNHVDTSSIEVTLGLKET